VFETLANPRHRTVLSVLDREGPMHTEALAAAVAVRGDDHHSVAEADAAADRARVELRHVLLPTLEAAGLVSVTDETIRASFDGHDAVPDLRAFLESDRRRAAACLAHLAVPERRAVLTVLSETEEPTTLDALAAEIRPLDEGDTAPDLLPVALHHVHLPKLDEAGLVRYDHEDHVVEPVPLASELDSALRARRG
jgi:hypothetical protein